MLLRLVPFLFLVATATYEVQFPHHPTPHPTAGQVLVTESIDFPSNVNAGEDVYVYMTVTDAVSDVCCGFAKMHYVSTGWSPCYGDFKLYNGTARDGTWLASCFVPADANNGDYNLEVHLDDEAGNFNNPQHYDGPITVSGGTVPYTTKPMIKDLEYDNDHVFPGDALVVNAHVTDSQSGVSRITFGMYDYYSPDTLCKGDFFLVSGDVYDGQWEYKCVIPQDAPISFYDGTVTAYDNKGNSAQETKTVVVDYPGR